MVEEEQLGNVVDVVSVISQKRIEAMRRQLALFWSSYLGSLRAITLTTLQIINDRVFPYAARKYDDWNEPPDKVSILEMIMSHFKLRPILFCRFIPE